MPAPNPNIAAVTLERRSTVQNGDYCMRDGDQLAGAPDLEEPDHKGVPSAAGRLRAWRTAISQPFAGWCQRIGSRRIGLVIQAVRRMGAHLPASLNGAGDGI